MWNGCNMEPSARTAGSSAQEWSKQEARRSSAPAANNQACSCQYRARKKYWHFAASRPAADTTSSGNTALINTPITMTPSPSRHNEEFCPAPLMECRFRSAEIANYSREGLQEI